MKKILCLLLILALQISMLCPAFAESGQPLIYVESTNGFTGDTIDVNIKISGNTGISGAKIKLQFDKTKLTLAGVASGNAFAALDFTPPGTLVSSSVNFTWDSEGTQATEDGTILTLTFQISDELENGEVIPVTISANDGDIYDYNTDTVLCTMQSGTITITDYIPGDVNKDRVVNGKDITLLRRYIAGGYGVTLNKFAADVNDDCAINGKDVTLIRRYIAGGYGVTLKHSTYEAFDTCGEGVYWKLDGTGLLTVFGSGSMESSPSMSSDQLKQVTKIVVQDGVTGITDRAFGYLINAESAALPTSVESMGINPFEGCYAMQNIAISADNSHFYVHQGCLICVDTKTIVSGSKDAIIPSDGSVEAIGPEAFDASQIETVEIPGSVTSIEDYSFNTSSLKTIILNENLLSIGQGAFRMTSISKITLPASLQTLGKYAFNSTNLQSIEIPEKIQELQEETFGACTGLESVILPAALTTIGYGCFDTCTNLTDVYYRGSEEQWENITIESKNEAITGATIHYEYTGEEHVHSASAVTANAATCEKAGNIAYWYCSDCGKYFSDAACTNEITLADTVTAKLAHDAVAVAAKEATVNENGNIAYWYCSSCGKYFSDAACTNEISYEETIITRCAPTVTFKDYNGTILKTESVETGGSATPPENPTRAGYTFAKWSGNYSNITEDCTVTAVYYEGTGSAFIIGDAYLADGADTVSVPVYINIKEGITTAKVVVNFGSGLSLTSITAGNNFSGIVGAQTYPVTDEITLIWNNGTSNITGDYLFVTLNIDCSAMSSDTAKLSLSYDPDDICNTAFNNVAFAVVSGSINK